MMDKLISQQAAIDKIKKRLFETAFNNVGIKQNIDETLIDVAENRLKNWLDELPSVQPNHCAEVGKKVLIDRQEALEAIGTLQTYKLFAGDDMILVNKAQVQTELMMLPSAQPEQRWIPVTEESVIQAGYEGKEVRFRIRGRLFAIRELAQ